MSYDNENILQKFKRKYLMIKFMKMNMSCLKDINPQTKITSFYPKKSIY